MIWANLLFLSPPFLHVSVASPQVKHLTMYLKGRYVNVPFTLQIYEIIDYAYSSEANLASTCLLRFRIMDAMYLLYQYIFLILPRLHKPFTRFNGAIFVDLERLVFAEVVLCLWKFRTAVFCGDLVIHWWWVHSRDSDCS